MTVPILAVTINAPFLLEIKEDNTELDRLLSESRAAVSEIASRRANWGQFMELLVSLRDNVAMQFALEEAYGYFENPACNTPDLGARTALLRDGHWVLFSELNTVVDHVEQRTYRDVSDVTPKQIAQKLVAFCDNLLHHDAQEYELVLTIQEFSSVAPLRSRNVGEG